MPLYWYECEICKKQFSAFHRMDVKLDECRLCEKKGTLKKLLTTPLKQKKIQRNPKVGDITKQHIKDNQDILEQERKKAKEEMYDKN